MRLSFQDSVAAMPARTTTRPAGGAKFAKGRELAAIVQPRLRTRDAAGAGPTGGGFLQVETRPELPNLSRPARNAGDDQPDALYRGTAELVGSFPPPYERCPQGGAYGLAGGIGHVDLMFYPGGHLDLGTLSGATQPGNGRTMMDGQLVRTENFNPVLASMNAKARAAFRRS
jgi:hypothetical protein